MSGSREDFDSKNSVTERKCVNVDAEVTNEGTDVLSKDGHYISGVTSSIDKAGTITYQLKFILFYSMNLLK